MNRPDSREASPEKKRPSTDRRTFLKWSTVGVLALAGIGTAGYIAERTMNPVSPETNAESFIQKSGDSLIAMHEVDARSGGWKFKSAIQAPHYQTDRDVGASSVGMGFLALAEHYPDQSKWLDAATHTADWLTSVSHDDGRGGRYWNDYNDNGTASSSEYTSFDDGTIGIGDFYWRLYEKTGNAEQKKLALQSVLWTLSQAESVDNGYRWKWDANDGSSQRYMGMGMGQVGIISTLTDFYTRLKDSDPTMAATLKSYIDGGTRYVESTMVKTSDALMLPETDDRTGDGGTTMNTGYLSGAAGAAYMYLNLYKTFGDQQYLVNADDLLNWLGTDEKDGGPMVKLKNDATAWKISLDAQGGDDARYATGFEEGAAGIGWTYIQAYNITGNNKYLVSAEHAADWLRSVADSSQGGLRWAEDENTANKIYHANLNNGAAGIGTFLHDLSVADSEPNYYKAAQGALTWLTASAKTNANGMYWNDNDGENNYSNDPSWHWGTAGIINAALRINGSSSDIPGEQSKL